MKNLDTILILIISICLSVQILYFESKMFFFYSFWVIFCPLDPGSQIIADPTNPDSNYIPPPPSTKKLNY